MLLCYCKQVCFNLYNALPSPEIRKIRARQELLRLRALSRARFTRSLQVAVGHHLEQVHYTEKIQASIKLQSGSVYNQ